MLPVIQTCLCHVALQATLHLWRRIGLVWNVVGMSFVFYRTLKMTDSGALSLVFGLKRSGMVFHATYDLKIGYVSC
jgi:hypothetical protein